MKLSHLSRTVSYALHACIQLAQAEPFLPVPCSQLAGSGNMPERFLLQILRDLVNAELLRSTRGVDGGYTLARDAKEISLLNIIEALEGDMLSSKPVAHGLDADVEKKLGTKLRSVAKATAEQLDAIKLSQLTPSKSKKAASR